MNMYDVCTKSFLALFVFSTTVSCASQEAREFKIGEICKQSVGGKPCVMYHGDPLVVTVEDKYLDTPVENFLKEFVKKTVNCDIKYRFRFVFAGEAWEPGRTFESKTMQDFLSLLETEGDGIEKQDSYIELWYDEYHPVLTNSCLYTYLCALYV